MDLLSRLPLARLNAALVTLSIFLFACGSSSVPALRSLGGPARWAALLALAAVALLWTLAERRWLPPLIPAWAAGAFLVVGFASAGWSAHPRLTLERAATLAALFAAAAALGLAAAGRREAVEPLLAAVLAGAALVAVAGLLTYVFNSGYAVAPGTGGNTHRFRGIGENPNTAAILFAAALPIGAWLTLEARRPAARAAAAASVLLLFGSIVAAASRGALLGGLAALLVVALALPRPRLHRAAVAAVVVAIFAAGALANRPGPPAAETGALPKPRPNGVYVPFVLRENEQGNPLLVPGAKAGRTLLGTSGRSDAWAGALRQAGARPLLGYGFGTEEKTFVDRYYSLLSARVENSYIGLYLTLGAIGLALFAALVASLSVPALRSLRQGGLLPAACLAVVVAGLVIAIVQSYVYSVGNVATASFWIAAFLLPGFSPRRPTRRPRILVAAALTLALVALVPLGRWERDRFADRQWRGIEGVRALVGPVDSRSLDSYRTSTILCLLYRRGADPYALELCWDVRGRLVEATDRRRGEARLRRWSIAWDPALSSSTEPVDVVRRLIERLERS